MKTFQKGCNYVDHPSSRAFVRSDTEKVRGQDSVQAGQALPHPTHSSISLLTFVHWCAIMLVNYKTYLKQQS